MISGVSAREGGNAVQKLEWLESYTVGIAEIDTEHRALIERLSDIQDVMKGRTVNGTLVGLFDTFIAAAENHFFHEESFVRLLSPDDGARHRREHGELLARATHARDIICSNPAEGEKAFEELVSFLIDDIILADGELRTVAQEQAVLNRRA